MPYKRGSAWNIKGWDYRGFILKANLGTHVYLIFAVLNAGVAAWFYLIFLLGNSADTCRTEFYLWEVLSTNHKHLGRYCRVFLDYNYDRKYSLHNKQSYLLQDHCLKSEIHYCSQLPKQTLSLYLWESSAHRLQLIKIGWGLKKSDACLYHWNGLESSGGKCCLAIKYIITRVSIDDLNKLGIRRSWT